jgi:2-polyprenyl-3-methyl-5-hydroxy-6-metoxy-1,4-benzoquinol methylase
MENMMDYIELNKKNTDYLIKKTNSKRVDLLIKNRYSIQVSMLSKYIDKNKFVLDIGIRDGAFLKYLKDLGYINLYGVDIYERSIEEANKKGINCEVANAQTLNLNKKFDVVVMSHVLEHCPDPKKVLDNIYNHLNENGILFIEVPIEKGPPKPTEKDAHYFNFENYDVLLNLIEDRWKVLNKKITPKRMKVVLRKI